MEPRVIDLTQVSREDWLGMRKLGSSDSAAVCGLNEWKSPYDVWAEKIGLTPPFEGNEATEIGTAIEPVIAELFSKRTGIPVKKCNEMFIDPEHDFLTSTMDYFAWEDGELGIVECKNTNFFATGKWDDGPPDAAHVQTMHQMGVGRGKLKFAYVSGLIGGSKLKWHRVPLEEDVIGKIREIEVHFWNNHVLTKAPPPLRADDGATLSRIYSVGDSIEIVLPDEAADWIAKREAASEAMKAAEKEKDIASNHLKALMGSATYGTVGGRYVSWKTVNRSGYTVQPKSYRELRVGEVKEGKKKGKKD